MAVTQYIGARYVPIFFTNPDDDSNDWKAGIVYDPLTIVTYLNQSYTSKIPVPASVGNPADNPQYWVLTGAYNAQVQSYHQDVLAYKQDVDDLDADFTALEGYVESVLPHKYLFIGDSYDMIYNDKKWSEVCAQLLGLAADDYYVVAGGGYGFAPSTNLKWEDLVAADTNIPADIDTVVIGGGLNDSGVAVGTLISAAASFNTYIKSRFTQVKRIYLSFMGMTYINVTAFLTANDTCAFYNYLAVANGWIFTSGVEHTLFDPSLMNVADYPDRAHPTKNGVYMLGAQLYQAIASGYAKTMVNKAGFATVNSALGYGSPTKAFYTRTIGGDVKLYDSVTTFSGSSSALTGFITLYTFTDMWSLLPVQYYQPVYVKFGTTVTMGTLVFSDMNTLSLYLDGVTIPANTAFSLGPWKMEATYR